MNDLQRQFIAALESGEYAQGFAALNRCGSHCALGVAGDVLVKAGLARWEPTSSGYHTLQEVGPGLFGRYIPPSLLKAMGLDQMCPVRPGGVLARLGREVALWRAVLLWNDEKRYSFEHIATILQRVWLAQDLLDALAQLKEMLDNSPSTPLPDLLQSFPQEVREPLQGLVRFLQSVGPSDSSELLSRMEQHLQTCQTI